MSLVLEIVERVAEARYLLDAEMRDGAECILIDLERLVDELPAELDDRLHIVLDVSRLIDQATEWLHVDSAQASDALSELLNLLGADDRAADAAGMAPDYWRG